MGEIKDLVSKMDKLKEESLSVNQIGFDNPVSDLLQAASHWQDMRGGAVQGIASNAEKIIRSAMDFARDVYHTTPGGPMSASSTEDAVTTWLAKE